MKIVTSLIFMAIISLPSFALDITTKDGNVFNNVQIIKNSSIGIRFICDGENRFIGKKNLTYESQKAIEALRKEEEKRIMEERIAIAKEIERKREEEEERIRKENLVQFRGKEHEITSLVGEVWKSEIGGVYVIHYPEVFQIIDDNNVLVGVNKTNYEKMIIKISKLDTRSFFDQQILPHMIIGRTGVYKYISTLGAEKRVPDFEYIRNK